jgi:integrase
MSRRPEIGAIQLYPNRPLRRSDRNGYTLKFYCPLRQQRVRRNCGTRDQREARRILRECRERLLNGEYVASGGAITAEHERSAPPPFPPANVAAQDGPSWQECYERYRQNRAARIREKSLVDSLSRLQLAETIFEARRKEQGLPEGLPVRECMTLASLEYLQDRLLAGDESRLDSRSPNTVNSILGAVLAFAKYCSDHEWIVRVPPISKLDVDEVMKGRPVTGEEFERMLAAVPDVVGPQSAASWEWTLRVLWESSFRVGDLMDFSWDDERRIHPVWPTLKGQHATIVVPPAQKNGRAQVIPMLPGLRQVLETVAKPSRTGWIVNPQSIDYGVKSGTDWWRPTGEDLRQLVTRFTNRSIAAACHVSETAVRGWLRESGIRRPADTRKPTGAIPAADVRRLRQRAANAPASGGPRLTKDRVSRIVSLMGEQAGIVVIQADERTGRRVKYASAHDLRRGCAQRLINAGVSAETLKVVMRHQSFATTEKHYGAIRSAQSAAAEVAEKLSSGAQKRALVGGLVGGLEEQPQLSPEEVLKLKSLLNSL